MAADNVVIYWVAKAGVIYAADMVSRTFVGISSLDRLGAAQRALDYAGIPHADWPHGEPSTMEEFGTEVRDAGALDGWITGTNAELYNVASDTGDSRRMLGVLLGTQAAANPTELAAAQLLQSTVRQIVVQTDGAGRGAWYSIGAGHFRHLLDFVEVAAGQKSGLLSRNTYSCTEAEVTAMRDFALAGNDTELWSPTADAAKSAPAGVAPVAAKFVAAAGAQRSVGDPVVVPKLIGPVDVADPGLPSTVTEAVALVRVAN